MSEPPSRSTATMWVWLIVVILVLGGVAAWQSAFTSENEAPDFEVTTTGYLHGEMGEPQAFRLSDHAGKVILLDMMAVHCPGCDILAQDVLKPIYAQYGNRSDFVLLSVDVWSSPEANQGFGGESNEDIVGFQKDWGFDWPHAQDTDQVFRKYSTVPIPMLVLVDKHGDIVMEKRGQPSLASVRGEVESALAEESEGIDVLRVGLFGMALIAGVSSFFAPCSIGLIPAYLGILLKGTENATASRRFAMTIRAGVLTGAGIVVLYLVVAVLLWVASKQIQPLLVNSPPVIAIALILFGLTMFRTGMWDRLAELMGMGKVDGRRGFFTFGLGYGLAAFGCTGPIFLPVLLAAFVEGPATGFAVFAIYAVAVAGLVILAAAMVATGHTGMLRRMLANTQLITRVAATLMILGGIVVWRIHYQATGKLFW